MKPKPLATSLVLNTVASAAKAKRSTLSKKSQAAIDSGDVQQVLNTLTERHKLFCVEYLVDFNGSAAVLRAGYDTKNPKQMAYQMLENPAIRIAIDALRVERNLHADVTKDYVLDEIRKTVKKASEDNNHSATLRGLELLARHLGMFIERTEISGPDGKAIEMEQRVSEDVDDFKSKLTRLARPSQEGGVHELPVKRGSQ